MNKILLFTLLATATLAANANTYEIGGVHHSKFLPSYAENTYKNTITINVSDFTADDEITVTRTNKKGKSTEIGVIYLYKEDGTYEVSWSVSKPARKEAFDAESLVSGGDIADGIVFSDYFTCDIRCDHVLHYSYPAEVGGDEVGPYTYTLEFKNGVTSQDGMTSYSITVGTVTGLMDLTMTGAHPLTDIQNDVDGTLSQLTGTISFTSVQETNGLFGTDGTLSYTTVDATPDKYTLYRMGTKVAEGTTPPTYVDTKVEALNQPYQGEVTIGDNTYGIDEVYLHPLLVTPSVASQTRSTDSFNGIYYFNTFLNIATTYTPIGETQISLFNIPDLTKGGIRIWRTVDPSAEEFEELRGRSSDYLYFDNVGSCTETTLNDIGSEAKSITKNDGTTVNFYAGTYGSSSKTPTETYRIRAYFYLPPAKADPLGAPSMISTNGVVEGDYYYVSEFTLSDVVSDNIPTAVNDIQASRTISNVSYTNLAGMQSAQPFDGLNIVTTTFSDGTTTTTKVMR